MIPERLDDYDWKYAFEYVGENTEDGRHDPEEGNAELADGIWLDGALPGVKYDLTPFGRADVEEVYAADEGENDGPAWICYGKLRDGRYFSVSAGCDYTGWDCQAGGGGNIAHTREEMERFGLTNDERDRFNILLMEDE